MSNPRVYWALYIGRSSSIDGHVNTKSGTSVVDLTQQGNVDWAIWNYTNTVNVWATGYDGRGTMTAKLNGATDVVLLSQTYNTTLPKAPTLFTFQFTPDNANDVLTIEYLLTTNGGASNSHVGIQAVTVSAIPEPSKSLLVLVALSGLVCLHRRR